MAYLQCVPMRYRAFLVGLLIAAVPIQEAAAQGDAPLPSRSAVLRPLSDAPPALDVRLLRAVYTSDAPAVRAAMRGADRTAFPVFYGAPGAAWGGAWLLRGGDDWSDAYRLTVSQVATYGAVRGLKALFQRPRPYAVLPDIRSRSPRYSPEGAEGTSFALPSGHASMAFAVATSWSLSHPEWYVIGPGAAWASAVALSRVWLGVHYPSDIVAGAVLGTGLSVAVHLLRDALTPPALVGNDEDAGPAPAVTLRFRF